MVGGVISLIEATGHHSDEYSRNLRVIASQALPSTWTNE